MPDATMPREAGKARPNDLHTVVYSLGGEDLGKCRRQETTWGKLRATLVTPELTNETHARYLMLSQEDKAQDEGAAGVDRLGHLPGAAPQAGRDHRARADHLRPRRQRRPSYSKC